MKNIFSLLTILFLINCTSKAQTPSKEKKTYTIEKTNTEWKKQLTPIQYYVLREAGTERAFSSPFNKNKTKGTYICAACKTPLYQSKYSPLLSIS